MSNTQTVLKAEIYVRESLNSCKIELNNEQALCLSSTHDPISRHNGIQKVNNKIGNIPTDS